MRSTETSSEGASTRKKCESRTKVSVVVLCYTFLGKRTRMAASQHSQPAVLSNFFKRRSAPVRALGNLAGKSMFFVCVLLATLACHSSWGDDGSPLFVMGRDGKRPRVAPFMRLTQEALRSLDTSHGPRRSGLQEHWDVENAEIFANVECVGNAEHRGHRKRRGPQECRGCQNEL